MILMGESRRKPKFDMSKVVWTEGLRLPPHPALIERIRRQLGQIND